MQTGRGIRRTGAHQPPRVRELPPRPLYAIRDSALAVLLAAAETPPEARVRLRIASRADGAANAATAPEPKPTASGREAMVNRSSTQSPMTCQNMPAAAVALAVVCALTASNIVFMPFISMARTNDVAKPKAAMPTILPIH